MTTEDAIAQAREDFRRQAWSAAFAGLTAADHDTPLERADLERLAIAAQMLGRFNDQAEALERAHRLAVAAGDLAAAVRTAFWLGFGLINEGEMARGGGWLARAGRLLEEGDQDLVESGYLLLPVALRSLDEGDVAGAFETFERIATIAGRFGDLDLTTLSRLGRGQCLVRMGQADRGVAFLDEAMVAMSAGEVSPMIVGIVYCAAIEAFQALFDMRRAQEWTAALTRWSEAQPDLVPYRGRCLVYRTELMVFHGAWSDAIEEARRAHDWLAGPPPEPAVGEALYQQAELHRLRGAFAEAEAAYREAATWGRRPEPGLALLRLAQGRLDAALAAIRRALDENRDPVARPRLLGPLVEIALAKGDIPAARAAAEELTTIADQAGAPLLQAMALRADGAIRLASDDAKGALIPLRRAWEAWNTADAPYESARVRVLIALACRQVGDEDAAEMELEAARSAFAALEAAPDLAALDRLTAAAARRSPGGLSPRELEILQGLAAGKSNRAIAAELVISERTVDRHVSNIFAKLDVSSRAAATAYAYEHGMV
jgi:DNA-binding CsgD family transcriptional regulator